jgi:alpha-glucosidase (family GH31 glycosyl hydrolase)
MFGVVLCVCGLAACPAPPIVSEKSDEHIATPQERHTEPTSEELNIEPIAKDGSSPEQSAIPEPITEIDSEHQSFGLGQFAVEIGRASLRIKRRDGAVLLDSSSELTNKAPLPMLVGWRNSAADIRMGFGMFLFEEIDTPPWAELSSLDVRMANEQRIELKSAAIEGMIELVNPRVLRVKWRILDPSINRVIQSFVCGTDERFFGTGARVHGTEHRGETIPAWVSEQGIGKIRRTKPGEGFPVKGDIHDTYLAVPFALSNRGFGLLVEDSRRSVFHFCKAEAPNRWAVEIWHNQLQYLVIDGSEPLEVVERLTEITGRPRLLPKWALAPWMDAVYGQDKVLARAKKFREHKIASSVIWSEDWVGFFEDARGFHLNYQWIADTSLYPDIKQLSAQLQAMGFKFFGYFNSFIEEGGPHWQEAHDKNYVIKDSEGKVIYFPGVFFKKTTLPDLTNPAVVKWIQGYMRDAIALGIHGWMADFGEWLPLEAKMYDGSDGMAAHNLYPVYWQKLNREIWDEQRPDGDYIFFARSGWTTTGGLTPVVWAGDQQTEFGNHDGLDSIIPIGVNAGISGIPIMTHDIAGYSSVGVPPSSKELFFRWTQLGAFSPIMRTHHGSSASQNWHWDSDPETIEMFRKYTLWHIALFPYRYAVAQFASKRGWPMMRHLYLHYPQDQRVAQIKDQFMLGSCLLIAPIIQDQARKREVYLPAGTWFHFFTGQKYQGAQTHTVEAKLDEIPVFAVAGAIIPIFLENIDTLAIATQPDISDIMQAESGTLGLYVYLGQDKSFGMYDGSSFELKHTQLPTSTPMIVVDQKNWLTCTEQRTDDCVKTLGNNGLEVYLSKRDKFALTGSQDQTTLFKFEASNVPQARRFVVTIRW